MDLYKIVGKIPYTFCDGETLNRFEFGFTFPFAVHKQDVNSPSCVAMVCDIEASGIITITKPSTIISTDGSVSWTVTSSLSSVKYSLGADLKYSEMTNNSGSFTGLGLGNYTIYARDSYGCRLKMDFVIDAPLTATVHNATIYRQEYKDFLGRSTRIDILKRDYAGAITEVIGTGEPCVLNLRGENGDFFDPIIATQITQNLISRTNFQFLSLYTDDDRMYQVIFYKDVGSGLTEFLRSFITPVLYSEKYDRDTNYAVSIISTDQLTTLKNEPFIDTANNTFTGRASLIQIIAVILGKTDLGLPIRCAVNIFDSGMSTGATDDPLAQTYIDVETNTGMTCWDVLTNIIGSFGANIFQWGGYWNIRRRGETTGSYAYRQYNQYAAYSSNGTIDSRTSAWKWEGRSQGLEMLGSRGLVVVSHTLTERVSYFKNGSFEDKLNPDGTIPGFTLVLNQNNAAVSKVTGNDSNGALKIISNSKNNSYGNDAYVVCAAKNVILIGSDFVSFSMDVFPTTIEGVSQYRGARTAAQYCKFKVQCRVGIYYMQDDGNWTTSNNWMEIIIQASDIGSWKRFEFKTISPYQTLTTTSVQMLAMHGNTFGPTWWYATSADLKNVATVATRSGAQAAILTTDVTGYSRGSGPAITFEKSTILRHYKLAVGVDAESLPTIIRPNDYNALTNACVWKQIGSDEVGITKVVDFGVGIPRSIIEMPAAFVGVFDNWDFKVLPTGTNLPTKKQYFLQTSTRNKNTIEKDFINGDPPIDITNALYSYINVYTLSTGSATRLWKRTGINEQLPILSLLAKQIAEQLFVPKFKLTGTMRQTGAFFGFDAVPVEYGKKYAIASMSIMDKMCHSSVEMFEITQEQTNGVISEFSTSEVSLTEVGTSRST